MKTAFLLFLVALQSFSAVPPTQNIKLLCDARPVNEQVLTYRFYEYSVGTTNFLGDSPTNGITLSNVLISVVHRYGVSASNVFGESDISTPYVAPVDPHPPLRLHLATTNSIVLESSLDGGLSWKEVANISNNTPAFIVMQRAQMLRSARGNLPPLPTP